jgi:hypothetical protein
MRYVDTGSRDADQALGKWFSEVIGGEVTELRWQAGFFFADGASLLVPTLERLRESTQLVRGVIGANPRSTLREDVEWLVEVVGLPRRNAALGLVCFNGGLYHPKSYHVRRSDGSQAAYVGSANLTAPALSGRNIEAGIVLDTRDSDPPEALSSIAAAVDYWFADRRDGLTLISDPDGVRRAYEAGVLVDRLPAVNERLVEATDGSDEDDSDEAPQGRQGHSRPRLRDLVTVPRARVREPVAPTYGYPGTRVRGGSVPVVSRSPAPRAAASMTTRDGYPDNFFFEPSATAPTRDADALSGATLPGRSVGIVVQLNKDSARHFAGGIGTANMSIPLATAHSLRFGLSRESLRAPEQNSACGCAI